MSGSCLVPAHKYVWYVCLDIYEGVISWMTPVSELEALHLNYRMLGS